MLQVLLLKIEIISKNRLRHTSLEVSSAKGKGRPDFAKSSFRALGPAGCSGTPPMHSNVFVGVFDLRLEFTRPPVVASAAENQK